MFGHRSPSSQIRYNGFSPFPSFLGTDRVFLRIVPLGCFYFGHSSLFCKKRSNYLWRARRTFRQNTLPVPNLASLPLKPLYLYFNLLHLCPNAGIHGELFPENLFLYPTLRTAFPAPTINTFERASNLYKFRGCHTKHRSDSCACGSSFKVCQFSICLRSGKRSRRAALYQRPCSTCRKRHSVSTALLYLPVGMHSK